MVLGITGNIASGKSSVAAEFARRGAVVVDADQLARKVVAVGSDTLRKLVAAFGDDILKKNGDLDRDRLGQMVFADVQVRAMLNCIIHPEIAKRSAERLQELRQNGDAPMIIYEAPLLFEVGAESRVDKVLVVKIDKREQLARLQARDDLDEVSALLRIDSQMSQAEKVARADFVINNSGDFAATLQQVDSLWQQLITL